MGIPSLIKSPRMKLALIPILAAILGFVLTKEDTSHPTTLLPSEKPRETLVSKSKRIAWPEFQLEEIAILQPFRTLKQLEKIQTAENLEGNPGQIDPHTKGRATATEVLQVRAIFQTPQGASALLGDRVVRVGDLLSDGKRIIAIHPQGVEIAEERQSESPQGMDPPTQ
jgi:hypothetical protein